ncbi:MAG: response regulator [Oligoflexia bacterium]|nr:response regulator [Oligoflexia bacterium]
MSFKILIVDDEPIIRETFKEFIQNEYPDADIECAGDGLEAFSKVHNTKYDLIISDYKMPLLNGKDFIENTRLMETKNKETKVIFCSAYIPEFKTQLDSEDGMLFIAKPVDFKSLVRNVKMFLYQKDQIAS